MPGRTDRPRDDPADRPGRDSPRNDQDPLMRRLANLPANHPSSPWYREQAPSTPRSRTREQSAPRERPETRSAEPRSRAGEPGGGEGWSGEGAESVAGGSGRDRTGKAGERVEGSQGPGAAGEALAATRRALRGDKAQQTEAERRRANDDLWGQAARWKAASDARREARGHGSPAGPGPGGREPFKPWFSEQADEELWLNADGGELWFWPEEPDR